MNPHTLFPALEELPRLVAKERQSVAVELRVKREQHDLRERMDKLLADAGVDVVSVTNHLGTFELRRAVSRSGERYATVTKVKEGGPDA